MKKNLTFYALATMMLLGLSSVFCACSSDDDDNGNQQKAGDEAVAKLKSVLLDSDNNVVFGEANEQGLYQIGLENQSDAQSLVANYVNNAGYTGEATLYTLPDGRGTVRVEKGSEDGIYYNVKFAVQGIPSMTLQVVEGPYMDNENKINAKTPYKCKDCGFNFKLFNLAAKKCTSCGSINIEIAE